MGDGRASFFLARVLQGVRGLADVGARLHVLAHRVQEAERTLYPRCIRWFAEGRLRVVGSRVHVLPSPAPVS